MEIADFRDDGATDETIDLSRLERLPHRAVKHVQHVLGPPVGKRHAPIDNLIALKKDSVHHRPEEGLECQTSPSHGRALYQKPDRSFTRRFKSHPKDHSCYNMVHG
jgi:hypothetical protein